MSKFVRKSTAALLLAVILLLSAMAAISVSAEEPVTEKPSEPEGFVFSLMKEAANDGPTTLSEDSVDGFSSGVIDPSVSSGIIEPPEEPIPNLTNVTAMQINDTQFELAFDSDIDGTMTFDFELMYYNEWGEYWLEYRSITLEVKEGPNAFAYDYYMEEMPVISIGYMTPDYYIERVPVELAEYTEAGFVYLSFYGEMYIVAYTGPANMVIPETLGGFPVTDLDAAIFVESYDEDGYATFREDIVSVSIPKSVVDIMDGTFAYIPSLTSITVAQENPNYSSIDGVLFSKDKTNLIACPSGKSGAYTIPDGVTSFNYGVGFWGCDSLTEITVPASIKLLEYGVFSECYGLKKITFLGDTRMDTLDEIFAEGTDVTIYGLEGSSAQRYASVRGHEFVVITAPVVSTPSSTPAATPGTTTPSTSKPAATTTTGKGNNPKTGEASPVLWFGVLFLAAGITSAAVLAGRGKKIEEK